MIKNRVRMGAMTLGVLAALFYLAAAFSLLSSNTGIFLGIAATLIAGLLWTFSGQTDEQEES